MNKPSEQRHLSASSKSRAQEPSGKSTTQPYYKAITIFPQGDTQEPRRAARQEQQPCTNNEEEKSQQERYAITREAAQTPVNDFIHQSKR
ncbi:hypothetical protein [Pseudomonas antarctica]|uniref:hypothetical protein n=1 Tax=Pseudomonas antarctica TaxID=219572 RepID=UPI00387B0B28